MMFSLHVDTARTWRGGQNQVLLTVNGLRAMGQRAALVAHPDGELRRRAAEGLDLIPIAPRTEMDLSAACAGFVFATHTAAGLIRAGMHKRALVIGAETLTRITDYSDRQTCILFGDGAGAFVLTASHDEDARESDGAEAPTRGLDLIYSRIGTDAKHSDLIRVPAGEYRRIAPSKVETRSSRLGAKVIPVGRAKRGKRLGGMSTLRCQAVAPFRYRNSVAGCWESTRRSPTARAPAVKLTALVSSSTSAGTAGSTTAGVPYPPGREPPLGMVQTRGCLQKPKGELTR